MNVYYNGLIEQIEKKQYELINEFIKKCPVITLGTLQDNKTHLTVITLLQNSSLEGMYMQCNDQSQKVRNIKESASVEIAMTDGRGYVIVECKAEVSTDDRIKREHWEDWFVEYHPDGVNSKNYVILKCTPKRVRALF